MIPPRPEAANHCAASRVPGSHPSQPSGRFNLPPNLPLQRDLSIESPGGATEGTENTEKATERERGGMGVSPKEDGDREVAKARSGPRRNPNEFPSRLTSRFRDFAVPPVLVVAQLQCFRSERVSRAVVPKRRSFHSLRRYVRHTPTGDRSNARELFVGFHPRGFHGRLL